jgi:putative transposase
LPRPSGEQQEVLARHAGASRFAFNQCLRMVKTALNQRKIHPDTQVPWTGFDLINAFNGWKKSEDAGRVFSVGGDGVAETVVTGLLWRSEVCQQVFEEAAVDCGRALAAGRTPGRAGVKASGRAFPASRRKPMQERRFGCATSTPRAAHP